MKHFVASIAAAVTLGLAAGPALAGDADMCLDCHEPAEDWEGMTPEEILADARNPEIKRHADGPIEVSGNFSIRAGSGRKAWSGRKAFLCRCGQSANKPFCDGAHKDAGFKAE